MKHKVVLTEAFPIIGAVLFGTVLFMKPAICRFFYALSPSISSA